MKKPAKLGGMTRTPRDISLRKSIAALIAQHLWAKILLGMVLGVATGLALSPSGLALMDPAQARILAGWIALPGFVFLELLVMVIIPLVICSIVLGILTSGSPDLLKKMGIRLVPYFIVTTACAVSIGLMLTSFVQPGLAVDDSTMDMAQKLAATQANITTFENLTIPQRILNLIPSNITEAFLKRDMLPIVIGAIIVGIAAMSLTPEVRKPFVDLCQFGQVITMRIISWAMIIAPYAVFGLLTDAMIRMGFGALTALAWYMGCVLGGLLLMLCLYLLAVKYLAGRAPLDFLRAIRDVQLLAFSTSSSAAVMPLSIRAAEENLNIKEEVSRFVIPLGATINMDGTALYQAVAALFLCQIFGVDLSTGETVLLVMTTVGASIGTPAAPGVGLGVLATILMGIGVPPQGIGIILGVDRILDMCRTTVNVTGDLTATAIMNRWMGYKA